MRLTWKELKAWLIELANDDKSVDVLEGTSVHDTLGSLYPQGGANGKTFALGYAGNDVIYGGNGKDVLVGGSGNDGIWGGNGDDYLRGDAGNDVMAGGNGKDIFTSFLGNDTLVGGKGKDTFIFKARENIRDGDDYSTITDYDGDTIQINQFRKGTIEYTETDEGVMISRVLDNGKENKIVLVANTDADDLEVVTRFGGGNNLAEYAYDTLGYAFSVDVA